MFPNRELHHLAMTHSHVDQSSSLERDKAIVDFCKHLATLSSAALAFVAAFSSKMGIVDKAPIQVAITFIALSSALSVGAAGISLQFYFGKQKKPSRESNLSIVFMSMLILSGLTLTIGLLVCAWATTTK